MITASDIAAAADVLRWGGLVVFPTETVYGIACDARNTAAVERVFEIKRRERGKALPVQVASPTLLYTVARDISPEALSLAEKYMPGPVTLVLRKHPDIPDTVTGGLDTVGVRVPDHPAALELLESFGGPIVATSANLSGEAPAANAVDAMKALGTKVDFCLDGGECPGGVPSTVVDMTKTPFVVLRQGELRIEL
ncbi:MAG: threonylcarbamoyl-AMP synthase [Abditibacteriota bacterium]|nr:threonylcarbamoyl-AMP synthase [Abditibacteriota bacterium]